ncbi:MAG: phosphatidylglycerol lysyltransferase domain-containing protein [Rhodospirillales bacterium]|nr:phosphatidylglycerol lysyltransferase domain-containing protein [Rhodospirillales bacterium]
MAQSRLLRLVKRLARHLPALLGLGLLGAAAYALKTTFDKLALSDVTRAIAAIPLHAIWLAIGATILSYWLLTLYDWLGTRFAGHPVSYARVSFGSFCAYALAHSLGLPVVSAAAVRYRLYAHWGLQPAEIARLIAFCSLTFGFGALTLGGTILLLAPGWVPFLGHAVPQFLFRIIGAGFWAAVIAYVTLSRFVPRIVAFGHEIALPGLAMAIAQVVLATIDLALTAAIFHVLVAGAPGLTFPRFLAIYLTAYAAGLATNLPGGIGVFDTGMLLGLSHFLPAPRILGALALFRLCYYIVPLFLAGSLFAGHELLLHRKRSAGPLGETALAVAAASAAVTISGVLLLSLAMLEERPHLPEAVEDIAGLAALAGPFIPSLIGAALLVLAVGLTRRVSLAWSATIALLAVAATVTALEGEPWWVPAALILAALLLAPYQRAFYRRARLLTEPLSPPNALALFALAVVTIVFASLARHVPSLPQGPWWQLILSPNLPGPLRLSVALAMAVAATALWRLVRPGRVRFLPWDAMAWERYAALGATPPAAADGLLLGEAGRAAIPFRRVGRILLGLGDPVGPASDRISTVWRLRDLALQEGHDPAIWGAGAELLAVYADLGLAILPLGADGLPSAEPADCPPRYLACVAERDLTLLLPLLPLLASSRPSPALPGA